MNTTPSHTIFDYLTTAEERLSLAHEIAHELAFYSDSYRLQVAAYFFLADESSGRLLAQILRLPQQPLNLEIEEQRTRMKKLNEQPPNRRECVPTGRPAICHRAVP